MNEKPISILKEGYGFWEDYIEHLREDRNIETLWPPQYQSLENGALEEDNFLLISSPGSGKTLVAELVMVYEFLKKRSSSVYLVPYKSLAEEKYTDFEDQLGEFGLTIKSSYGEGRKEPAELFSADISILTYEKFDYYLRNFPSTLTDIGSIIVDEFHKVSDPTRGPNLEITIARILSSYPNVRILGLSATVQNSEELGEWLGANICHVENWHKNKLIEGICTKDSNLIKFYAEEDQKEEDLEEFVDDFKANAIINFIKEADNQSLIFASTRSLAEESATTLAEFIDSREKSLDFNLEQNFLDQLAEEVANLPGTHGRNLDKLENMLRKGVAFHHAGLPKNAKAIIEKGFKRGAIKAISATTTLAAGVNLPVRRVFILKPRVGGGRGRELTVSEYKNLVGRAGRPQFSEEPGESVLFAKSDIKRRSLKTNFIDGNPEPVRSQIDLGSQSNLLLNLLRTEEDEKKLVEFLENTLLGFEEELNEDNIHQIIDEATRELESIDMIEMREGGFELTPLGRAASKKLLEPRSIFKLINYLENANDINYMAFLAKIIASDEFEEGKRLWTKSRIKVEGLSELQSKWGLGDILFSKFKRIYLTVAAVKGWIEGKRLDDIFEENYIDSSYWGVADFKERIIPSIVRVLNVVIEVLEESKPDLYEEFYSSLTRFRLRIKFGLTEETVAFSENGVAFQRSLIHHLTSNVGIKDPSELIEKEVTELRNLNFEQAVKLKRRAIKSYLDGYEKKKELMLLRIRENDMDKSFYRELLESDQIQFEKYCLRALEKLEHLYVEQVDEEGEAERPEAILKIKDGKKYLENEDGEIMKIGLECKSKQGLNGKVNTSDAMSIVTKAPECDCKVTVCTPDFEEPAEDAAHRNGILLLTPLTIAELAILNRKKELDPLSLKKIFQKEGEEDPESIREELL